MIVERIKIGPWTATPALNLLERGAQSIKIEPRAMDVLVFLARHDGAVVSVEELIASVWKGAVVGDGSVYLAIRQLRQALDDPADGIRYIETISKRGYRLTVSAEPVETIAPEPVSAPAATQASIHAKTGRARRWWPGAAVVGAVVVAGIVFALRDGTPPVAANTVAVLPFENLSSDPQQEYFADGVTAEILNALSRVRDLRVTGRISSFHFKDRSENLQEIATTLGVEHILQGSVRRAGDQVRITAQLSNASTGEQLWYETYERRLDDIFAIQDEIAKSVANALQVKLGVGDVGREPGMTRNVAAYDEYLRALAVLDGQAESFQQGIPHLQRAVALDPSFSIAWGRLSVVYTNGANFIPAKAADWRRLADDALERARVLTPDAPHVLLWTGITETRRGHWREAAGFFKQLDESYVRYGLAHRAWGQRGIFLTFVGRVREATPILESARAEDPLALDSPTWLSLAYTIDGDFQGAFAEVERGLNLEGPDASFLRTAFLIAINKRDRVEIDKRLRVLPDSDPRDHLHHQLARFIETPGSAAAEIRRLAAVAGQAEMGTLAFWAAYYREPELSLELWSRGMRFADGLWQPVMRDVRKLPGFKDVVRELGLVDYWRAYSWSDFCHPVGNEDFSCS